MADPGVKVTTFSDGGDTIRIVETPEKKFLKLNGTTFSKFNKRSVYTRDYWDYFIPLAFAFNRPRVLVLGMGGGTIPYQMGTLTKGKASIDSVEISRKIAGLAKKFMPKIYGRIIIDDAFDYVARTRKRYDLVVLDVYDGSLNVPGKFLTSEFVGNVHRILSDDGILAINYVRTPGNLLRFGLYRWRLRRKFGLYAVRASMFGELMVLICSKSFDKDRLLVRIRERFAPNKENLAVMKKYAKMKKA